MTDADSPAKAFNAETPGEASAPHLPQNPRLLAMAYECNPLPRVVVPASRSFLRLEATAVASGSGRTSTDESSGPAQLPSPCGLSLSWTLRTIGIIFLLAPLRSAGLPRGFFTARKYRLRVGSNTNPGRAPGAGCCVAVEGGR